MKYMKHFESHFNQIEDIIETCEEILIPIYDNISDEGNIEYSVSGDENNIVVIIDNTDHKYSNGPYPLIEFKSEFEHLFDYIESKGYVINSDDSFLNIEYMGGDDFFIGSIDELLDILSDETFIEYIELVFSK